MPSTTPPTFTIVSSRALILYKQLVATWDDEFERIVKNASFSQVFPDGSVMFEGLSLQQELFQLGLRHNVASRPELSITAASYRSLSCWPSSYYDLLYPASYNGRVLAAHDAFTVCPGIFLKQESPDQQQLDDFPITFEFRSSPSKAIQDGIQTRLQEQSTSIRHPGAIQGGPIFVDTGTIRFWKRFCQVRANVSDAQMSLLTWIVLFGLELGYSIFPVRRCLLGYSELLTAEPS